MLVISEGFLYSKIGSSLFSPEGSPNSLHLRHFIGGMFFTCISVVSLYLKKVVLYLHR